MESSTVPETVQLIVLVAGLCSSAPALEVMRPAGMAPRRSAHRNLSYHKVRFSSVSSASANALATRLKVSSISWSMHSPCLDFRRYFLSQMSRETGCTGTSWVTSLIDLTALSMGNSFLVLCRNYIICRLQRKKDETAGRHNILRLG